MSKAILVIDMPKSCEYCVLYSEFIGDKPRCSATYLPTRNNKAKSHCPLKPMPEKVEGSMWNTDIGEFYEGYNRCIDEILGGSHE